MHQLDSSMAEVMAPKYSSPGAWPCQSVCVRACVSWWNSAFFLFFKDAVQPYSSEVWINTVRLRAHTKWKQQVWIIKVLGVTAAPNTPPLGALAAQKAPALASVYTGLLFFCVEKRSRDPPRAESACRWERHDNKELIPLKVFGGADSAQSVADLSFISISSLFLLNINRIIK